MNLHPVRSKWIVLLVVGVLAVLAGCSHPHAKEPAGLGRQAKQVFGTNRSGLPWFSGAAVGGDPGASRPDAFGQWRGRPLDFVTTYQPSGTFAQIASTKMISPFDGFAGRLALGVPLLPDDRSGTLKQVAQGRWDWAWDRLATSLVKRHRGNTIIRLGWEPNGDWYPWSTVRADAGQYRSAYAHVAARMKRKAPDLVFSFDVSCGTAMRGQQNRTDALDQFYPGDAAVNVVGCDDYDWHSTKVDGANSLAAATAPDGSVGLSDVAAFARAHGKAMGIPEWGVASRSDGGLGDNEVFVNTMHDFLQRNRDLIAYEGYFNDDSGKIRSSLFQPGQNPQSASRYVNLW